MSLARDVITRLRAAVVRIGHARTITIAIRDTATEVRAEIQEATDGTGDERPAEAVVRLEQAKVRLDEALAEFDAGTAAVHEYIAHLDGPG